MITINGTRIYLYRDPNKYTDWTVVNGSTGDIWAAGTTSDAPSGYGGCLLDYGWESVEEYVKHANSTPKWLGHAVKEAAHVPDDVYMWLKEIII